MTAGGPDDPFFLLAGKTAEEYMGFALKEARKAFEADEVPVGAILVDAASGQVVARAHNQRELLRDPTAHAEVLAITQGAAHYSAWRLSEVVLYVTLEPCLMCAGAIIQARIPKVVYGADDPRGGAHRSVHRVLVDPRNNHQPEVVAGVRADESGELLRSFFKKRRSNGSQASSLPGGGPPGREADGERRGDAGDEAGR